MGGERETRIAQKVIFINFTKKKGKAEANLRGASLFDRSLRTQ